MASDVITFYIINYKILMPQGFYIINYCIKFYLNKIYLFEITHITVNMIDQVVFVYNRYF